MVQISRYVATHLHFALGSVWFHTGKIWSEQKCITKSHVGAVTLFIGQKLRWSYPLSFNRSLNVLNTSRFSCSFPCFWAVWSSAQVSRRQRISSLLQVNRLCDHKLFVVCLQDRPQPIMHSTSDYGSWLSPQMYNSSWSLGIWKSDQVHTTYEPSYSSFVTRLRPPL